MNMTLAEVVEQLAAEGRLTDVAAARHRLDLGMPPWLVLQELPRDEMMAVISRASGIPLCTVSLTDLQLDLAACEAATPELLLERRWLPLADGRVVIANPFQGLPDGPLAGRPLCLTYARGIDLVLDHAFPNRGAHLKQRRRLGRYLLDAGLVSEEDIVNALAEQRKNGGRLGEILIAQGAVDPAALTQALSERIGIEAVSGAATALPLLPRALAHALRAVAIETRPNGLHVIDPGAAVSVALTDPSPAVLEQIENALGRPIDPHLTDAETLDALLAAVYAAETVADAIGALHRQAPDLSALRTAPSKAQLAIVIAGGALLLLGMALSVTTTAIVAIALGTVAYVFYTVYRLYSAWRGWRSNSTINPTPEELAAMDGRELPGYTVLLPVFREKTTTMRALFQAMSDLQYPKHKLNGLLLLEEDDQQTLNAIQEIEEADPAARPRWLKPLFIPASEPRTKPKAMIYALSYATGDLLTIYDAEDKPEPDQLMKAAWAFQHAPADVACIQAKLSYYNSRQNLLTRWFTLEYAAWFDLFLPGLHSMAAPIPLGGTSNHFRLRTLREVLSWDPFNVTEDADLGLRFTRAGYRTQMLESTTYEEANSRYHNWLRQRSRWIKGYMQTFLVHTRNPLVLYKQLGLVNCLHFLATVGGLVYTVLISPFFWALLGLWLLFQPGWIPQLFPGPVYYLAMASLVFGNFFFVYIGLAGAVGRGQDDLAPYTLIFPFYWLMMSVAAYFALYELVRKPHYWQKTEHGLHETDDAGAVPQEDRKADIAA